VFNICFCPTSGETATSTRDEGAGCLMGTLREPMTKKKTQKKQRIWFEIQIQIVRRHPTENDDDDVGKGSDTCAHFIKPKGAPRSNVHR
jgi:hypothetical protein